MNKRSFLKATGVTFVASLLAFGRRADDGVASVASAQENVDLTKRVAELAERYAEIEKKCGRYETQLRLLQANDGTLEERLKGLSFSFIGTIAAISTMEIPDGWRLCDGTPIPDTDEFQDLRGIIGEPYCFPDYRGVFLRGLDELAADGSEMKPEQRDDYKNEKGEKVERVVGSFENFANYKHSHETEEDGKHSHTTDVKGAHNHMANNTKAVKTIGSADDRIEAAVWTEKPERRKDHEINVHHPYNIPSDGNHSHNITSSGAHKHVIKPDDGAEESRPKNVAVRYVIRYA